MPSSLPVKEQPAFELCRLDYEQTLETYRQLADVRFKLLALVPALTAAAVALLGASDLDQREGGVVSALGFLVTLGIVLYDLRNSQFYNGAIGRAQFLEEQLGFQPAGRDRQGGLFRSRDEHPRQRFLGLPVRHGLGLSLIYSAVLGAWVFSAAHAWWSDHAGRSIAAGAAVALVAFVQLEWLDGKPKALKRRWG